MQQGSWQEVGRVFFVLGTTAFGGPAAHIARMREELVVKRQWLNEQTFLDLVGATNLIPGPNSTELAIHIGYERAGWKGLLAAGIGFIVPAVSLTVLLAWLYVTYGQLPEVKPFFIGVTPALVGIIAKAIFPMMKTAFKSLELLILSTLVFAGAMFGLNELILLFGAGFGALMITWLRSKQVVFLPFLAFGPDLVFSGNWRLFFIFLKVGSILYGSGYVLFAFLEAELVDTGMLQRQVLLDAIAAGQFTPGPVFSSVAFIGYYMNGWSGALVSAFGIFLPSFVFVALIHPIVRWLRSSTIFTAFLNAVNAASVALIAAVCLNMLQDSAGHWSTLLIAIICGVLSFATKWNSVWILLLGSVLGWSISVF
jgi:chromate transporter